MTYYSPMVKKSSAHYQRQYRERLRSQGFVKKEVWVLPERAGDLREVELALRSQAGEWGGTQGAGTSGGSTMAASTAAKNHWSTRDLCAALEGSGLVGGGSAQIELIDGIDPSIHLEMLDYGDLPLFITVAGEQIIVDAVLWPESAVRDVAAFNDAVLRTHKLFPLSTISLETVGADSYYYMFGALSSQSSLDEVLVEIDTLAANVLGATEAYREYLNTYA